MRDSNRLYWNEQFKILQDIWPKPYAFEKSREIFITIHGMVHSSQVSPMTFSFEDELWNKTNDDIFRYYFKEEQSIAWKLWHSARIEDITMNILIANESQVLTSGNWTEKIIR